MHETADAHRAQRLKFAIIRALSVHLDINSESGDKAPMILREVEHVLLERYRISHTTLQIECTMCANGPMIKEFSH